MAAMDLLELCTECEHTYVAHHKGARCLRRATGYYAEAPAPPKREGWMLGDYPDPES